MSNYILSLSLLFLTFFHCGNTPDSFYEIRGIWLANGERLSHEDTQSLRLSVPLFFKHGRFYVLLPKDSTSDTLRCAGFFRRSPDQKIDKICLITGTVDKRKKRIKSACLQELKISPECSRVEIKRASAGGRSQFYCMRFRFLQGSQCLADVNQSFLFSRANWLKRIGIHFVTDSNGNRTMILPSFQSRTRDAGFDEPDAEPEIDETLLQMYLEQVQSGGASSSYQQPTYQPQQTQWLQPLYEDPQQIFPIGIAQFVPLIAVPVQMVYVTPQQQFPTNGPNLVTTQASVDHSYSGGF